VNIIIGGTKGLGYEIARLLRAKGEETFVAGRTYEKDRHGEGCALDLASDESVDSFARFIREEVAVDGLKKFFWVAGYGYLGDFAKQDDAKLMAETNFANVLPIAQAAWQKVIDSDSETHFVVISSTTGFKPRDNEAVYSATKHAQVGFTRSLGLESKRLESNVKVSLFLPGGMQTAFWEGDEPEIFSEFNDPAKVAKKICDNVDAQHDFFYEEVIERGTV
jgi:short-subunit dehydrogenase